MLAFLKFFGNHYLSKVQLYLYNHKFFRLESMMG